MGRSSAHDKQLAAKGDGQGWAVLKQQMVSQLPKKDVFSVVLMSVAKAFMDLNQKEISDADRHYLVNELTDNIIGHYPSIRLNEIPDAIWLGVRGRFGEFFGLSLVTFEGFIRQYLLSDKRTAMVKAMPPDDPVKLPPGLPEQFETCRENALRVLRYKAEGRDIAALAPAVYNFLDKLQLLPFTNAEKYDMLAEATRQLLGGLKQKLILGTAAELASAKADIDAYQRALTEHTPVDTRQYALVKMQAKKLALEAFLNNIMLEESDLAELMESRKEFFIKPT
ncbi:MAG TPA: hypothetical protein VHA56_19440 [Mucilaginibacter sp.]|nr:hypothetical protein [Mucilaginibacter sp.]